MKQYIILLGFLFFPLIGKTNHLQAQSDNQTYIKRTIYLNELGNKSISSVDYYDDLGRIRQTVQIGVTPDQKNLYSLHEYDEAGRKTTSWLPFPFSGLGAAAANGAFGNMMEIMSRARNNEVFNNDSRPYTTHLYEDSPLDRVVAEYGPGKNWGNRPVTIDYTACVSNDSCIKFVISDSGVKNDGYYYGLYGKRVVDEDGYSAYEFRDEQDRLILQRQIDEDVNHDTYYVYDKWGNLCYVLPPGASDLMLNPGTYSETDAAIINYAYVYKYDDRMRCIEKRTPGVDPIFYIYDKANQLVFYQDGELRNQYPTNWYFNTYDNLGRIIIHGICQMSNFPLSYLRTLVGAAVIREKYDGSTSCYGYTDKQYPRLYRGYPISIDKVLSVYYYDDYRFKNLSYFGSDYDYQIPIGFVNSRFGSDSDLIASKGHLTGSIHQMLDQPQKYISTINYYDKKGNCIQSVSSNLLGGYEKEYTNYSFTNQPVWSYSIHSALSKSSITELYQYDYDHADRLTTTRYKLNNDPEIVLSELAYNELGEIKEKKLGGNPVTETITYQYNIRSWIKNISSASFSETLYYEDSYSGSTPCYNGNISAQSYQYKQFVPPIKGYRFFYDGLNRLVKGESLKSNQYFGHFDEEFSYDKMGNILTLTRYKNHVGGDSCPREKMDDLEISYTGNQIKTITESGNSYGFSKSSANTTEYVYNKNGSLVQDYNRKISGITYNCLNLPNRIQFGYGHNTRYSYDASGVKRQTIHETVKNNLNIPMGTTSYTPSAAEITNVLTTDYCGKSHIVYENGELKYILTPEGYVSNNVYHYYMRDHLGNNRSVIKKNGTRIDIVQETFYYPSGMPYPKSYYTDAVNPQAQPYKFGGKELDDMHGLNWYDFEARQRDGILPVFTTIDPLVEKYYSISPYAYCLNNPMKYVDPDGRDIKLYNIIKLDNSGNPVVTGGVSSTTNAALKDLVSTKEGRAFFAQFAKAGDIVGGHTFTKDGTLSDVTLNLWDYSYEKGEMPSYAQPNSGSIGVSDDKGKVTLKVVSAYSEKVEVGETLTHETQVHGYKVSDQINRKLTTTESQDHKALKNQDTKHQGYKQYKSTQEQLQNIDEEYKKAFQNAQKEYQYYK